MAKNRYASSLSRWLRTSRIRRRKNISSMCASMPGSTTSAQVWCSALSEVKAASNPHAVSGAPAYGLMQLVPTSGGREAYRRARIRTSHRLQPNLLDPENNIELGAAYLSVLTYDQLDKVADRTSRDYCVISAYNTGPSNVMRAFTDAKGKQRFEEGFQRINRLSPPEVFQTLREKLPYEETRGYLPTVNTNRKRYYSIDKTVVAGDSNQPTEP